VFSRFENGKWRAPQVAPFSGQYSDYDPFISPDGNKLFFISNRPVDNNPKKDYDIWVVEKMNGGWSAPKNLGVPINNDADQFYPSVAANGTMYFSTIKREEKSGFDLYRSKFVDGKYTEPEKLSDAVNSQFAEIDACIAPDESYIVFASYNRPEELGRGDLYISFNENGVWTPAKNLGEKINSNAREYCPILSPDGKYFFFTSFRGFADKPLEKPLSYEQLLRNLRSPRNGMGNIYQIDIAALHAQRQTSGL
jgi:Tol biopolymer transport system component